MTKPIMVGKTPYKLLYTFEVKVCNKWLATKLPDIRVLKRLIHSQTSWPQLISELLDTSSS